MPCSATSTPASICPRPHCSSISQTCSWEAGPSWTLLSSLTFCEPRFPHQQWWVSQLLGLLGSSFSMYIFITSSMCRLLCGEAGWGCGESRWTGFLIAGCQCLLRPGMEGGVWLSGCGYTASFINIRFFLSSQQIRPALIHPHLTSRDPSPRGRPPSHGLFPPVHFRLRNELGSLAL